MGCVPHLLHMTFIIIIITITLFLTSLLPSTHILTVDAPFNEAEDFHVHGLQKVYLLEQKAEKIADPIKKVSGQDKNEETEGSIVEKFRALLGLKSLHRGPRNVDSDYFSPSPAPSPIETEDPAPAPVRHTHPHLHPQTKHHSHRNPNPLRTEHEDKGKGKRTIVAISLSAAVGLVICAIGFFWVCKIFRKRSKRAKRTMPLYSKKLGSKGRSSLVSSQSSTSKVSYSGLDPFNLSSLRMDIEQHPSILKQTCETAHSLLNHSPKSEAYDKENEEEVNKEAISLEFENASTSYSAKEVLSVHDDAESSTKHDSDGGHSSSGDKIIPMESHSSDDESFHSFGDSHFSNLRLSNASAASLNLCVTSSVSNPSLASLTNKPIPPTSPDPSISQNSKQEQKISSYEECSKPFSAPPPPPPPPPPPSPLPPSYSLSSTFRIKGKESSSTTIPSLSTSRNSGSSSGLNQNCHTELSSSSPRNPTNGPSVIPPPPCPPPFLQSNKNPPPPPSQLPQFTPMGKDGAPLPKLKPLHWDKVRAAPDRTMVWDKLRSSSFELDEEMIESLFGYNLQSAMKSEEGKSKTPSPSNHVLEPKRLQNITILSKALNLTAQQVCEALMQGDGLGLQQLEALVKMVPNKEEESNLCGYKGDMNELGSAERFVITLLNVPFAFSRAEAMLYRATFEDEVVHLRNSFSMLEEACKELRSSRLFLKLLEAVLKTGNRMNVGTIRGGAKAFKLDALLKLADVKGADGKTSLLHFVVQEIVRSEGIRVSDSIMGKINQRSNKNRTVEEKEEDYRRMGLDLVSGLSTELYNVKKTAAIDLDVLASSVSHLTDGMVKLQNLIQSELDLNEKNSNFARSMKPFLSYVEKNLKELQGYEDRVIKRVKDITEYFHGDVSKEEANPLRIFVIVRDFLGMLDSVCKELRRSKVPRSPNPLAPFR